VSWLRWVLAFVVGAGVCTVLDHQHVVWGVLVYPSPDVWEQAWWVPLLFGCATLVALGMVEPVRRLLGGAPSEPSAGLALADGASFAAAYYLTAVGQHAPDLVAAALVVAWLVRAAAGMPAWGVAFCLATALGGPAFESLWSSLGFFHYLHPDFIGVARWLPALYLHVGVISVSVGSLMHAPARAPEPIEIEVVV
jgi:hypothetical protein